MTIGEKLKKLRKDKNKSRQFISKELGISVSALSNYENNIRIPTDKNKIKIAKYFNRTVQYIFFEKR